MKRKVESRTAETILQKPLEVMVGEETYTVAPPSTATLILVSELVARLPGVSMKLDNYIVESLAVAKDCRVLGEIVATLILGALGIKECRKWAEKRSLWGVKKGKGVLEELAEKLLEELSPKQLHQLAVQLLSRMEIEDFFSLTASLMDVNLTRPTKDEAEKRT